MTSRTSHSRRVILILGALTAFPPMSIDLYLPALPTLQREFNTTAAAVQLTLATFFISFAAGQLFYGPLVDRWGRKRPLFVGVSLYVVASAGCALAPTVHVLMIFRALQAFGACAAAVVSRAIVRDLFEPQQAVRVFATLMMIMGAAPILAPLLGGYILLWSDWRTIFWLIGGFGFVCLGAAHYGLPNTFRGPNPDAGPRRGIIASYWRLLMDRRFVGFAMASGVGSAGMFAYVAGSSFVFIDRYGMSPQQYGWLFGINACGLIGASQLNRLFHRRLSAGMAVRYFGLIQAAFGAALLLFAWTDVGGLPGILLPLFGYVASVGLVNPNATAAAMAPFQEEAGSASALLGTLQFSAGTASAVLMGWVQTGSAVPMAGVIAGCGVLACTAHRLLIPKSYLQNSWGGFQATLVSQQKTS